MSHVPFKPFGTRPIDVWRAAARQWQPLLPPAAGPRTQLYADCLLLGLAWPASERDIKQAARRRIAQVHPRNLSVDSPDYRQRTEATREALAAYRRLLARVRGA